jgi:hypothetical protein
LIDEDWWSNIDFLLKFTSLAFELSQNSNTHKSFSGEFYDVMDTIVEKTMEMILYESLSLFY